MRALRVLPLAAIAIASALGSLVSWRSATVLVPERAFDRPSLAHWLGCGEGGVDLASFVARAEVGSLALAVVVSVLALAVGAPLGAAAGLARGRTERVVARVCDLLQAFPSFLFAVTVLSTVRAPTRVHLGVVFFLTAWVPFARLALAETRVLRSAAFVEAARALGLGPGAILFRHVLPQVARVCAVQLGASGAALVVGEAALAFVGFGTKDGVSVGALLDSGVVSMLRAPHVLAVAATSVFLTSVAMMSAGRALAKD